MADIINATQWTSVDHVGISEALSQARKSYNEGGIPIGCSLISADGTVLGKGHNQRIQKSSPTLHAEIAAVEDAGRLKASTYRDCTIYTTLSPCSMCTGAILLYKIPRVVIGENKNFSMGGEDLLRQHGVKVVILDDPACTALMAQFIREKPEEWNEDIGEV
ncbi:cytidine deaminase-like protein [Lentinula aff. detonsa]|uniref:Cytosine deaminase n=1 Tax=Lentinula aff. detonsa TaxID=2804958 RepID=A0AA38NP49_9AGAR|nr:cytidine deaminase-like protein [Lentinula aff. detonsa]